MKQFILIYLFIYFTAFGAFAEGEGTPPKGKIKGAVVDASSNQPLEYATIALYEVANDKLITGTITDHLGHFKIEHPEDGEYYLFITFVGLKDHKSDVFTIDEDQENLNLGSFFLESAASELGEVEIVSRRAAIEYKIDKKVINVDKQLTAESGNAVDILENVPSVQVDVEGNVSLRGSTGFTVLIDGKPTILDPSDALRQIPSSSIQNIEIITNPSVKYEPDGATGIINIITKKNRLDGLSGIVNANVGMFDQYGGDLQLSYRMNKFNFIVGANYNKRTRPGDVIGERETTNEEGIFYTNTNGNTQRERINGGIRAGFEYDISKNDFISLSGRYGNWSMDNRSTLRYDEWNSIVSDIDSYNSIDETTRGGEYYNIDGVYQHTFTKKKIPQNNEQDGESDMTNNTNDNAGQSMKPMILHTLRLQVNYQNRYNDENTINELRTLSGSLTNGSKSVEKGPMETTRVNIDYTLPVGKQDKFEAGVQFRNGTTSDITELWLYDTATNQIEYVDRYSNFTDYYRNIYAVYSLYAGMVGNFGYQAGLRAEYTDRKIQMTGEDEFIIDRLDFFPTIHVSYNLPYDQQVMASYSRRIDRPRSWWLEPFITFVDPWNVRMGNPDLQPEYIDSYEMGYLKKFGDNFFSLEGYYRVTRNKIERVSSVFTENVLMRRPENIGEDYSLGIEAMLTLGVTKWWEMQVSGNFFNYRIEGELSYRQGDEIVADPISEKSTNWNSRFNNTFTLWKNGQFQVNSRYNSASITAQGTRSGYFTLDAAFRVTFLDKSLSVNIQGRDLLGTALRENISEGPGFITYNKYDPKSPVMMLSVSYRFNNFKASRRSGSVSGDGDRF